MATSFKADVGEWRLNGLAYPSCLGKEFIQDRVAIQQVRVTRVALRVPLQSDDIGAILEPDCLDHPVHDTNRFDAQSLAKLLDRLMVNGNDRA